LETGEPTGILYGMGNYLAVRVPGIDDREMERGISLANERLLSYGITSIQDASAYNEHAKWKRFEEWKTRDIFRPRI